MTFSNNESQVMTALETVIDPELGIDIVNLGLIYEVEVINHHCHIKMTLTTQGCPLSDLLHQAIQQAVLDLPTIDNHLTEIGQQAFRLATEPRSPQPRLCIPAQFLLPAER